MKTTIAEDSAALTFLRSPQAASDFFAYVTAILTPVSPAWAAGNYDTNVPETVAGFRRSQDVLAAMRKLVR